MSLIPHSFFPRRMFDMDNWVPSSFFASPMQALSTMDIFDPFDELDRSMSRNLRWFDRPTSFQPVGLPTVPQKYRISVNCAGYAADCVKTELKDQKDQKVLLVHGKEEIGRKGSDDYSKKELKKTFVLPKNIEFDKMASFMTPSGMFIVEFPLCETASTPNLGLLPQYTETEGGNKQIKMAFPLPQNIDPSKLQVSVKDRDLIMRVEDKTETPDAFSRVHIYTRTTLPENTDFSQLKCVYGNNQLCITAPVYGQQQQQVGWGGQNIPVELKQQQQQQLTGGQQQQYQQQG